MTKPWLNLFHQNRFARYLGCTEIWPYLDQELSWPLNSLSFRNVTVLIRVTFQGTVPGVNELGIYAQVANEYKMEYPDL
jgi:hypothetical protein